MPLPRMTTRRWMIAVAVMAFAIATGTHTYRHFRTCQQRAANHARVAQFFSRQVFDHRQRPRFWRDIGVPYADPEAAVYAQWDAHIQRLADWHAGQQVKFEAAVRRPWLPVPPDPPEPK